MMKKLYLFCWFSYIVLVSWAQPISSPNGNSKLSFELVDSTPVYSLSYKGKSVIKKSRLGLTLANAESFTAGFYLKEYSTTSFDETWSPVLGEIKSIRNNYTQFRAALYQPRTKRTLLITFRVFDDGIGFRYEFPQQDKLNYFVIKEEESRFVLPGDLTAWWIAGDYDTQEYSYTKSRILDIPGLWSDNIDGNASQTPVKNTVQAPLMMKSDEGIYLNISEAALIGYPAMHLEVDTARLTLKSHLTPDALGMKGYIQTPFSTPWRTVIVADKPEKMLESRLILNLNEPTQYLTTDWIKPTKYIGIWWEMINGKSNWSYASINNVHLGVTDYSKLTPNGKHAANNEYVKKHIDFAARHKFDAVLVEGWNQGWEDWIGNSKEFVFDFVTPYPDFNVKNLASYAKERGVKLIMHHETSASAINYERWMDTAFKFMKEHGYDAVKTGYVGNIIPRGEYHYGQWMVDHYLRVVKKAEKFKIMINSHESVRPTGLQRTYPNWIAAEAARGTEYEVFQGNNPEHTTILPFTRLMGGPMDYTPGIFETRMDYYFPGDKRFVKTTLVKQLALYVTMYSPLQMAADIIDNYERFPDAFQFIKDVPTDWDDTKVLKAEPGDYILIARKEKNGDDWYVGGITDENARSLEINMDFLEPGKKYEATIYEDAKEADYITAPQLYKIYKKRVDSKTKLTQKLARSGGVAISIRMMK